MEGRASYTEGVRANAVNFAFVAVLGLATGVITARIYGAQVIGQYALVLATANAVMVLSTARERPGFVREVASLPPRAPRLSALWLAMLAFSFVLTLAVALLALVAAYFLYRGPIGHPSLFAPAVVAVVGYLVFDNTIAQADAVLTVFRAGKQLARVRTFKVVTSAALTIGFGLLDPTVWAMVIAGLLGSAAALVWRSFVLLRGYLDVRVSRHELRDGFRTLPDIIRFGLKIAPGAMADGASNQSGTWILGSVMSLGSVGAYNRGWQLVRNLSMFNTRVTEMLFPTLIERHRAGDRAGFDRALVDTLRYSAAGLLLLCAAVGGAADGVMQIYGHGFGRGSEALPWLLAVPALMTLSMVQRHALYVVDRPLQATVGATLRLLLTVGLAIPLALWLGVRGPAIALCVGLLADFAYTTRLLLPELSTPLHRLWPPRDLVALAAALAAGFATARWIDGLAPGIPGALLAMAAATPVYVLVLIGIGGLTPADRVRVRRVLAQS